MKIKDLITELSKYDINTEIYLSIYCEMDDSYYNDYYYALLNKIYFSSQHNAIVLEGDNSKY